MAIRAVSVRQIASAALFLLACYACALIIQWTAPGFDGLDGVILLVAPVLTAVIAANKGPRPVLQALIAVIAVFGVLRLSMIFETPSGVLGLAPLLLITLCIAIPVAFGVAKARRRDEPEGEDPT